MHAGIIGTREVTLVLDDLARPEDVHRVLVPRDDEGDILRHGARRVGNHDASMEERWKLGAAQPVDVEDHRRAAVAEDGRAGDAPDAAKQLAEPLDHRAPLAVEEIDHEAGLEAVTMVSSGRSG